MIEKELAVFKIGGPVLSASPGVTELKFFHVRESLSKLISCLSSKIIPGQSVVVHGGGDAVSCWLERFGMKPVFIDGLRVTDARTMEIVEMVLSGLVNKKLVSKFNEKGFISIGISGRDLKESVAVVLDEKLGFVGEVETIKPDMIFSLLEKGILPVLSPVCENYKGDAINVNADFFASKVSVAIGAKELNIVTSSGGVLKDGQLIKNISLDETASLIADKTATEGMIPKLRAAVHARNGGVEKIRMLNYSGEEGTVIE